MGCRDSNPGECAPCAECAPLNGEKMVRVGCISDAGRTDEAGECKPARMVVRTPLCPKHLLFDHWGEGCARECSLHLCNENDVYDWTDGRCKACTELRDGRLCSLADTERLRIRETGMTGNLPSLQFMGCLKLQLRRRTGDALRWWATRAIC